MDGRADWLLASTDSESDSSLGTPLDWRNKMDGEDRDGNSDGFGKNSDRRELDIDVSKIA